jgi:hypothetical protein
MTGEITIMSDVNNFESLHCDDITNVRPSGIEAVKFIESDSAAVERRAVEDIRRNIASRKAWEKEHLTPVV